MLITLLLSVGAATAHQDNWPQWRGPLQNGVAPSAQPPLNWSETQNVKWKVKIPGLGSATPIIWDNLVFVQTAVPTGKKGEPQPAAVTEQRPADANRPAGGGPPGGGPGGPGGRGGSFGPGSLLAERTLEQGDQDKDQKLSLSEFSKLADAWFQKLDPDKAGKIDQELFASRFSNLVGPPADGGGGGTGGGRGGGFRGRFLAPGFFSATDADKNGTLTGEEFKGAFTKWFAEWDSDKNGSIDEANLREGFNAALPRPQFGGGGPGGPGGPGGGRGRGGFGGEPPTEVHQFMLLALDRATGKVLWQAVGREEVPHEPAHRNDGTFASPSGLTDGENIYAYFGSRGLYAYDFKGKQLWQTDLGNMRIAMSFGEGSSPAISKDALIINWDNEDGSFITALDKKTGKPLWKEAREERTTWSTPLVIERQGKAQVVTTATGKIRSYDAATGKLLWQHDGLTRNVIPSPVADEEKVYCMSGFQGSALTALWLDKVGAVESGQATPVAWTYNKSTPYVPSPLLYGRRLYFFAGNNATLTCLDTQTGKPLIDAERLEELQGVYASPLGANGRVYLVGRNGATVVLKHSDRLEKLATNRLDDRFDASAAAAGKELFLRGREYLYCLAEK